MLEPSIERLSVDLNETVDLGVLDGGRVLFVAQHPAPQRALMAIARVGAQFPAYTMASGKVLLAQLPREEILRRLPRRLEPTLGGRARTREALLRELEEARRHRARATSARRCATASAPSPWRSPTWTGARPPIAVPMPTARFEESEERVAALLLELKQTTEARLGGA